MHTSITFRNIPLIVTERGKYAANDSPCLQAYSLDGEPWFTATVCVPEYDLPDGHVVIKDWSENDGVLDALVNGGVVSKPVGIVSCGWAYGHVCQLLM